MFEVEKYRSSSGRVPFDDFIAEIIKKKSKSGLQEIAQITLYIDRLTAHGMEINSVYPKSMKKIQDNLYELRPGNNRIFFFYYDGKRFIVLHGFRKSSNKTPKHQIEKAFGEIKEYINSREGKE